MRIGPRTLFTRRYPRKRCQPHATECVIFRMGTAGPVARLRQQCPVADRHTLSAGRLSGGRPPSLQLVSATPQREDRLEHRKALERFLAGIERRAFIVARLATGNRDEALDIVQDAMLKLSQRYGDRAEHEWGALFHRILQRRIYDWYRRAQVRRRWRVWFGRNDDDDAGDPMENVSDPAAREPPAQLAAARAMSEVEIALARLPLRQQQAFVLRVFEGLDVADTARAMGCSVGSIKTHYSRALERLRELLAGHEP